MKFSYLQKVKIRKGFKRGYVVTIIDTRKWPFLERTYLCRNNSAHIFDYFKESELKEYDIWNTWR